MNHSHNRLRLLYCYTAGQAATGLNVKTVQNSLDRRLAIMRREGAIFIDLNHPPPGEDAKSWTRVCAAEADIVILLISDGLVDSDLWDTVIPQLLCRFDQGAIRLIPVMVHAIDLGRSELAGRSTLPGSNMSLEELDSIPRALAAVAQIVLDSARALQEQWQRREAQLFPRRLLLGFANPTIPGLELNFAVGAERERIKSALALAPMERKFAREELWAVSLPRLLEAVESFRPDLLHLGLHIEASGELMLEDMDGRPTPTPVEHLWEALSRCDHKPRALVFNACNSALLSLASMTLFEHVIGMAGGVGDLGALDFSSGFYRALALGADLRSAYWKGRAHEHEQGRSRRCEPVYLHRPRSGRHSSS